MWIVYKIEHIKSGRAYIGLTGGTLEARWNAHVNNSVSKRKISALGRAIAKYGVDAFSIRVLTECASEHEAAIVERGLIAAHGTYQASGGFNITFGGEIPSGRSMTKYDKERHSAALTGIKKKMTPDGRARLAAACSARFLGKERIGHSEKLRRYIANNPEKAKADRARGALNRVHTPEQKAAQSERSKKMHADPEMKKRISVAIKQGMIEKGTGKTISDRKTKWHADPVNKALHREKARIGRLRYLAQQRMESLVMQLAALEA